MQYLARVSPLPVRSDKSYVETRVTPAVTVLSGVPEQATMAWRVTWVLLALAVYRFWIAPLATSLWLDETGTFWAIRHGLRPMLTNMHEWPSTVTALYGFVVWVAYAVGGAREYVLRL